MLKILIADDQPLDRKTLHAMLSPHGECMVVADGAQAVAAFARALAAEVPFQVVLLDIQMPVMDGQEALLRIRQLEQERYGTDAEGNRRAFIIMQTSLDEPAHLLTAFKQGRCNSFINKPVVQESLLEQLKRHHLL
ncbi:MAG: response regulator [Magnetococcus sp. YQC-3]